jgi:parallel beta-helix repeat protein
VADNEVKGCGVGILMHTCSSVALAGNLVNACGNGIQITGSRSVTLMNNLVKNSNRNNDFDGALFLFGNAAAFFPTVEVFAAGNKFFDDQEVKTQNIGVWQAGTGAFQTHFIQNDVRGNISSPFQVEAGAIATRLQNLGDAPANAAPSRHLSTTLMLDFDLSLTTSQDLTVSVPGAVGDVVSLGPAPVSITPDTIFSAWVSAPDIVTVRALRTAGNPNPPQGVFRVNVLGY